MMPDTIKDFPKQFEWEPKIENASSFTSASKIIVLGMGGSHLAADILKTWPDYARRIIVHSDYGLPLLTETELKSFTIVASSYSGNTEEVIDGAKIALEKKLDLVIMSAGGLLIELAQKNSRPYIQLPPDQQPRLALGFSFRALLKILGEDATMVETKKLAQTLEPEKFEKQGQELAARLKDRLPVIYSSFKKETVAYNWKTKLNETGKIPAFLNTVPELNHNEISGFDVAETTKKLSEKFYFIFLEDAYDHPKNQKRMAVLAELYQKNGFAVEKIKLQGQNHWHKIFSSLMLADWTSYFVAKQYGQEPEPVPLIEKFKKMMAE